MSSTRQPLLTVSPSQHVHVSPSDSADGSRAATSHFPQTTPKLPRRERLASFSRLLRKDRFSEFSKKSDNRNGRPVAKSNLKDRLLQPSVDIVVSSSSPTSENDVPSETEGMFTRSEKGYLTPSCLPFSPGLLNKKSPFNLSPDYRHPSPLRSPLYHPDGRQIYLGRGSFGKVSLCRYKDMDFAVKIIHHPSSQHVGERNLLGIRHPHLVEIFHISTVLDRTVVFMEFAGHCNLQTILDTKSELDLRRKLSFCSQIASGLRHCHQHRIVHGDVKPANVMVNPMGICKLGDFGLSTRCGLDALPRGVPHPAEVGTVAYAAPEVLKGSRATPRSDMYSFGILLWQVETRELPFAGEHPHVIIYKVAHYGERPKLPDDDDPVMLMYTRTVECCWQTDPRDRIDANQSLTNLQNIMEMIKDCKRN